MVKPIICCLFIVVGMSMYSAAQAPESPDGYLDAMTSHFMIPYDRLVQLIERGVDSTDLPALLTVAYEADLKDVTVMTMRNNGLGWTSVLKEAGLDASVFYVKTEGKINSERFSSILAKFNLVGTNDSSSVEFSDDEVEDLANVKFLSEYYKTPAGEIISKRDVGATYQSIAVYLNRLNDMKAAEPKKDGGESKGHDSDVDSDGSKHDEDKDEEHEEDGD